ncbi:kinase-like domain-containing protein [Mycena vulgaris]|nr:kinase-like domain-containing protein [Mycena vulgaris]
MASATYPKVLGYDLVGAIGGGGFSRIFRAVNLQAHRVAACKFVYLTAQTSEKERKTVEKEMRIHAALKHTHVLEFINAVVVELVNLNRYVPGIYMLLELAEGGDLFDKIVSDVGVSDEVGHVYFNQLLAGMDYIHKEGVCHRDLKPENLLLEITEALKISDFGLSSVFKLKETGRTRTLMERCGSPPYVAPELNYEQPYEAEPIDVWGVGVILYTLLAGNTPWDEATRHSPEFAHYVSGAIFHEAPWDRFNGDALSLIQGLLTIEPRDCFTLADAFERPWCTRSSKQGPTSLADALAQPLRNACDLSLAAPHFSPDESNGAEDEDEDGSPPHTQFTQTLMLFPQTPSGRQYTPHLTRFYAMRPLAAFLAPALEALGATCRDAGALSLRTGGHDARKDVFRSSLSLDAFAYRGAQGSFCTMQRDFVRLFLARMRQGSPLSWRRLWRALIESEGIAPHVMRK